MRQTTGIIILESLTGLVLLVGLVFGLIAWRLVSGPTDLSFVKTDVESAFSDARGGQPVKIEKLTLRWQADKSEFQIYAENLEFYSRSNEMVARSDSAVIDVNGLSLLTGHVSLQAIEVETGELTFERDAQGQLWIAGQMIPAVTPIQFHEASTPLQYVEQSLLNVVDNISRSALVANLESARLNNFRIHIIDVPLQISWTLEESRLDLKRGDSNINIEMAGDAFGEGAPDRIEMSARLNPKLQDFDARVNLIGLRPLDLDFMQTVWSKMQGELVSDISMSFGVQQTGIESLSVNVVTQPGSVVFEEKVYTLGQNDFSVIYRFAEDDFIFDGRNLDAGPLKGSVNVELDDAARLIERPLASPFDYKLDATGLFLDFRPVFKDVLRLDRVDAQGNLDLGKKNLNWTSAVIGFDDVSAGSEGALYLADNPEPQPKDLPFGIKLTAQSKGIISPDQVLEFWPLKLGGSARTWVADNVHAGDLSDAVFSFDLKPASLRDNHLDNEELKLDFAFRRAEVGFLSDLPHITDGVGQARLEGNSFSVDVSSGSFGKWDLTSGTVAIEEFEPKTTPVTIVAEGRGQVTDMLRILSDSDLQLETNYGLNVASITGEGEARFTMQRPARDSVSYDDTPFSVSGTVKNGGFQNLFRDATLSGAQAKVLVTNDVLQIAGYGQLEDAPIEFDWKDNFRSRAPDRTLLKASGYVSPDLLNRFGIAVRTYLSGNAFAKLTASGPSSAKIDSLSVNLDLADTRLDFTEFGWLKPMSEPATADILFRDLENLRRAAIRFESEDVNFDGEVSLNPDGLVEQLTLGRLYVRDQMDVRGELVRTGTSGLDITVSGPYLNATPFVDGLFGTSGALPIFGQISLSANIEELKLRKQFSAEDAELNVIFDGPKLKSVDLSGEISGSGGFMFEVTEGQNNERILTAKANNAGALISGFLGIDFVRDGKMDVTGILRSGDLPTDLNIKLNNVRLVDAPLLTQILSLASLRGLADVMTGEGIMFSEVTIPLVIESGDYFISGAKAAGPALGLTAKGYLRDDGKDLSVDGVLVPSFGVNSALGGIPILGDLFVSRDGEGVFAMTYSVRGSLESARVAVNPLSGIVPGVLRRIFENPESEPIPEPDEKPAPQ